MENNYIKQLIDLPTQPVIVTIKRFTKRSKVVSTTNQINVLMGFSYLLCFALHSTNHMITPPIRWWNGESIAEGRTMHLLLLLRWVFVTSSLLLLLLLLLSSLEFLFFRRSRRTVFAHTKHLLININGKHEGYDQEGDTWGKNRKLKLVFQQINKPTKNKKHLRTETNVKKLNFKISIQLMSQSVVINTLLVSQLWVTTFF